MQALQQQGQQQQQQQEGGADLQEGVEAEGDALGVTGEMRHNTNRKIGKGTQNIDVYFCDQLLALSNRGWS